MARRFSSSQRVALFLAAQGRCELCGDELQPGWHADHVIPWVRNGETDTANGQALCPTCNLKKGASLMNLPPCTVKLRPWQSDFLQCIARHHGRNFLLEATPAAGKTTAALKFAHQAMSSGLFSRLAVVVPTSALKHQWELAARKFGIDLFPLPNDQGVEPRDTRGVTLTYQQVAANPHVHRMRAEGTLVIFDEIHHAGDTSAWGEAIQTAFGQSPFRLGLSGTPFRSDSKPISFVRYEERDGQMWAVPDFRFGYGDALRAGIVRPVTFEKWNGDFEWVSGNGGKRINATFDDDLNDREESERLRVALDHNLLWMQRVIKNADDRLNLLSGRVSNPGGLIVCVDMKAARKVAKLVRDVTGQIPVIVVSEDSNSDDILAGFTSSSDRWLVSVRKVSEGVDIPRLLVGCYFTNIISPLYFRQFIGRFVRSTGEKNLRATVFLPGDKRIVEMATQIEEEVRQALPESAQREAIEREATDAEVLSTFQPLKATGRNDGIVYDGKMVPQQFVDEANVVCRQDRSLVGHRDAIALAFSLKEGIRHQKVGHDEPEFSTYKDEQKYWREQINLQIRRWCKRQTDENPGSRVNYYSRVHSAVHRYFHVAKVSQMKVDQLKQLHEICLRNELAAMVDLYAGRK